MAEVWVPGRTLREAIEVAHDVGYFRESGDDGLDRLYDTDREAWIDGYLQRYYARQLVYERVDPSGRWAKAFDMRMEDGTYIGVRVDITELKTREKALRDSMAQIELYRHVLDELPVSAYVKNADLAFEFVNKMWCDLRRHLQGRSHRPHRPRLLRRRGRRFRRARPRGAAHRRV